MEVESPGMTRAAARREGRSSRGGWRGLARVPAPVLPHRILLSRASFLTCAPEGRGNLRSNAPTGGLSEPEPYSRPSVPTLSQHCPEGSSQAGLECDLRL